MKTYNRCPSCNRKPVVSVRKSIVGTSDIASIEIEELYTKVVNNPTYYGELAICFNCRLVYNKLFFDPAELRYIYAKAYRSMEIRLEGAKDFVYGDRGFTREYSERIYEMVKTVEDRLGARTESIVDVGGRDGFMLRKLAERDYKCTVVDPIPIPACSDKIRKIDSWSSEAVIEESPDLILLCDVLSHCVDPAIEIANNNALLKEGGILYIEVPCDIPTFFSWLCKGWIRKKPLHIDITHFTYFSIRSLLIMLKAEGLDVFNISVDRVPGLPTNYLLKLIAQKGHGNLRSIDPFSYSLDFDLRSSSSPKVLVDLFYS